jgi:DNA-binding NarL/FixJ family response regulator
MVDDHPIVLAGLKALVDADPDFEVVGEARDGRSALRLAKQLLPDVVVLDISMPEMNGIEVATVLLAERPECRVLVLTVHEDRAYLRQLVEAGVSGYLLKRSASDELIRAMHAVASGGMYLDPAIAGKVVRRTIRSSLHPQPGQAAELSERETDVLRLVAGGHSNKEISARLNISVKTVETYKARAMEKLGYRSRVEVVRYAADQGWLRGR